MGCTGNACDVIEISKNSDGCLVVRNTSGNPVYVSIDGLGYDLYGKSEWKPTVPLNPQICIKNAVNWTAKYK